MSCPSLPLFSLALSSILAAHAAAAAVEVEVGTANSTLEFVSIYGGADGGPYPQFAGDVVADVNDPLDPAVCRGGWVAKSDPQYEKLYQSLMAAKLLGGHVRVIANPERLWGGSSGKYCYINGIFVY